MSLTRCGWVSDDPLYVAYHDHEWGVPLYDDQRLFELLMLEGAQAGLSWITILRKREGYRQAFDGFDAHKIVNYDENKIANLLANPGIVRNRLKVRGTVKNARAYLKIIEEADSFSDFVWQFIGGEPRINHFRDLSEVPAHTETSDVMAKALKKKGFTFVGSTICYAFMQACGMVNDHTLDCFCHPSNRHPSNRNPNRRHPNRRHSNADAS